MNLRYLSILEGKMPVENTAWFCRVESRPNKEMGAKAIELLELPTKTV